APRLNGRFPPARSRHTLCSISESRARRARLKGETHDRRNTCSFGCCWVVAAVSAFWRRARWRNPHLCRPESAGKIIQPRSQTDRRSRHGRASISCARFAFFASLHILLRGDWLERGDDRCLVLESPTRQGPALA